MCSEGNAIRKHWEKFMNIDSKQIINLAQVLVSKRLLKNEDIYINLISGNNERHNKRMFLFELLENTKLYASTLVEWLNSKGYTDLAEVIRSEHKHCQPFIPSSPLIINVTKSTFFSDSAVCSPNVAFYSSRSKKRGRVLIINNCKFNNNLRERKGAHVDGDNLRNLFTKLGGWVIVYHENKTKEEMNEIFRDFARYDRDKVCDICMVFVMSHGTEHDKDIIVYGSDSRELCTSNIHRHFLPNNCKLFIGKPKIFIYQICRGSDLGTYLDNSMEMDSTFNASSSTTSVATRYRMIEDMMYGYSTQSGYQSYRDIFRGTWYIELICQIFMNFAHCEPLDHLLMKVDEGLRVRQSENSNVQTSEIVNSGFKKLFFNPGIYEENNELKMYQSD